MTFPDNPHAKPCVRCGHVPRAPIRVQWDNVRRLWCSNCAAAVLGKWQGVTEWYTDEGEPEVKPIPDWEALVQQAREAAAKGWRGSE